MGLSSRPTLVVVGTEESLTLGGDTLGTTLTGSAGLDTVGLSLLGEDLSTGTLSLGLVDVLHKDTLVLEDVTLGLEVETMVEVLVNLASLTVLAKETTEDTLAAHPDDLGGHTGLGGTVTLTVTGVATLTLGLMTLTDAVAGVGDLGLADDETVLDELTDVLAGVGIGDLLDLVRVKPDLTLTTLHDASGKALLTGKVHPRLGGRERQKRALDMSEEASMERKREREVG